MIPTSSCAALAPGTRESTTADPARLEAAFVFTRYGAAQFREGGSEPADHSSAHAAGACLGSAKRAKTVCSSLDSHYRYRGAPHPSKPTPRATALVATRPIPDLVWPPTFPARPPLTGDRVLRVVRGGSRIRRPPRLRGGPADRLRGHAWRLRAADDRYDVVSGR